MDSFQKKFSDYLEKINVSESTASLILGILVVVILAALAYNFFRVRPQGQLTPATNQQNIEKVENPEPISLDGKLTTPSAAVSLPVEHTVQSGETLWSISQKYYTSGYNWVDIAKVNNITNPSSITVGQKLTIPNTQVRQPTVNPSQVTTVVTTNRIEGNSYTVIRGDNLWNIAVRAYGDGFAWTKIAQANHLANPSLIHAGNVFIIPR